jgi:KDO2-lipid IV(A) lauroyltransferase
MLVEDPRTLSEDEISERHTRRLEQEIIQKPELWLWSHRRWKHKKPGSVDVHSTAKT